MSRETFWSRHFIKSILWFCVVLITAALLGIALTWQLVVLILISTTADSVLNDIFPTRGTA